MTKGTFAVVATCIAVLALHPARAENKEQKGMRIREFRRIWDKAPHNAFTDLLHHKDRWWCVFREGKGHVSPAGKLRVITSPDGVQWESAVLLMSATEGR